MTRTRGPKRLEDKHPEILEQLGKVPDAHLADQYGVHTQTIGHCRRRNGVSPYVLGTREGVCFFRQAPKKIPAALKGRAIDHDKVIVAFKMQEDGMVSLLNSYSGVRVFDKDAVDPRVTMAGPLPHFHTWKECEDYLMAEPGKHRPCLLSYTAAKKTFNQSYADYTEEEPLPAAEQKILDAAAAGKGVRLSAAEVKSLAG